MSDPVNSVEVKSPELLKLIDKDAVVEKLCTGFWFTEGPIWNPKEQCLYFSDMPGDVRRRWSAADGVKEVRKPSNKCNGMTYDGAGNLYVCEHVTSSLVMETPSGERKVLASHWQGKELNSPNDVVVRSDNTAVFQRSLLRTHAGIRPGTQAGAGFSGSIPNFSRREAASGSG